MINRVSRLGIDTDKGISIHDVTPQIRQLIADADFNNGFVTITSQHTTTALAINEFEQRLIDDTKIFLQQLIPQNKAYLHNDIHLRDCPEDEPENAHSHLAAMLLGSSEVVSIVEGELILGQYQSVLLYELDGPRKRSLSVQLFGE